LPQRALRACSKVGCPTLVKSGRCPQHAQPARQRYAARQKDPAQVAFYRSQHWRKLSLQIRAERPVCERCRARPSRSVNHKSGDWRDSDPGNLEAVCQVCEPRLTGRQHGRKSGNRNDIRGGSQNTDGRDRDRLRTRHSHDREIWSGIS